MLPKRLWSLGLVVSITASILCSLCLPQATHAQTSSQPGAKNVDIVGHYGGIIKSVAVQGNYAYVAEGLALTVLDISGSSPQRLGSVWFSDQYNVEEIVVAGRYAYVITKIETIDTYSANLWVVDISMPQRPQITGHILVSDSDLETIDDIAINGSTVYLAGSQTLRVISVQDPSAPVELDSYMPNKNWRPSLAVTTGYAYMVSYFDMGSQYAGLQIIDVSNPNLLIPVGSYMPPDPAARARDIVINGRYAYLALETNGPDIEVLDLVDPKQPMRVGRLDLSDEQTLSTPLLALSGETLYLFGNNQLRVISLAQPDQPVLQGTIRLDVGLDNPKISIAASGTRVAIVSQSAGLQVFDTSDPTQPRLTGTYTSPSAPNSIATDDQRLYLGSFDGLHVLDKTKPELPELGSLTSEGGIYRLVISGSYIYAIAVDLLKPDRSGLRVIDVSVPTAPKVVGEYILPNNWLTTFGDIDLTIAGQYVYIGHGPSGLRIVDISDPTTPREVASYREPIVTNLSTYRIVVQGQWGFLMVNQLLRVVDLSDPTKPRFGPISPMQGSVFAVQGEWLYVATAEGIAVFSSSIPVIPQQRSFYRYPTPVGTIYSLVAVGDHLYLGAYKTLRVIDISRPALPVEVGAIDGLSFYKTPLAVPDGTIYSPINDNGMVVLHFTGMSIGGQVVQANRRALAGVTIETGGVSNPISDASGTFTLARLARGTYTLTPTLRGLSFFPPTRTVELPPNGEGMVFLALANPVSRTVTAGAAASLSVTDTQGLPTQLDVPAGAITTSATLALTPTVVGDDAGLFFTGQAVELGIAPTSEELPGGRTATPITLSMRYSDANLGPVRDEELLVVRWWDNQRWIDAPVTCGSPAPVSITRDPANNHVTVPVCRPGRYALFAATVQTRLVMVTRQ